MTRAELLKAMSKAEMPDLSQAGWNKVYAANMLAAIEAAGCVVVPREATRGMRLSGFDALNTGGGLAAAWVAMLAASPLAKEPGA